MNVPMSELITQPPKEYFIMRPDFLLQDNRSSLSERLRGFWNESKRTHSLIVMHNCGDARVSDVDIIGRWGIISLNSIASANTRHEKNEDPFLFVYTSSGAEAVLVNGHYDGETVIPGVPPKGCGGLGERAKIAPGKGDLSSIETAAQYVAALVESSDVVVQTLISAAQVAQKTDLPVYATVTDHITYRLSPIAIFQGGQIDTLIPLSALFSYNPELIYKSGIPEMNVDNGQRKFIQGLVLENRIQMQELLKRIPDFAKRQKVQDPHTILISTDIRSPRIRYPKLSGPGAIFNIRLPYDKDENGKITGVSPQHLNNTFAQTQYPISHVEGSVPGGSFNSTRNIIIETPDLDLSRAAAVTLMGKDWMAPWLEKEHGSILVAQVNQAQTKCVEKMNA